MSDVRPPDGGAGYRGALPPRNDWLARGWVLLVIALFIGMFVLAALNVPSVFFPEPTPVPFPSVSPAPSESAEPSGSAGPTESAAPSGSAPQSPAPSPTP